MSNRQIQTIHGRLLDELIAQARSSPRRRAIHCFHRGDWEHAHRMLNALARGTYVRPHRHGDHHQSEGFILLRGRVALLIFDETGKIVRAASRLLSSSNDCLGMDIPPLTWHTLVALEDSVIYEVKGHPAGGYMGERDKEFAPWSPAEGELEAEDYLQGLEKEAWLLEAQRWQEREDRG
jgi:cupin fold WbuC family metalloprotein